jgi:hypothetical protein
VTGGLKMLSEKVGTYVEDEKYMNMSLYQKFIEKVKDKCLWKDRTAAQYMAEDILKDILSEGHSKGFIEEEIDCGNIKFHVPDACWQTFEGPELVHTSKNYSFSPGSELYPANKYTESMIQKIKNINS